MFLKSWQPDKNRDVNTDRPKTSARFSPKIIAAIHGKPLVDHSKERVFDDDLPPVRIPKTPKIKKQMQPQAEELPVMEAGKAPEGIQSTKDYGLFRLLATNRPVDQSHVNRLCAAIRTKNLLHLSPIVVNTMMEVMDGQHRLEAAKKLGISIFYVLDEAISQDDIAGMNSNKKNWALKDYIHYYAEKGHEDYQRFDAFCKEHSTLPPATLLSLVAKEGAAKRGYKEGNLDISGIETAAQIISHLADFSDHTRFAYTGKFVDAIAFMVRTGDYDHGHMVKKLDQNPGALQPAPQVKGWIENLERIYNKNMREENIVIFLKRR